MKKYALLPLLLSCSALAQERAMEKNNELLRDSVRVSAHPSYNKVSGIHRFFFGENYRKEWATPATLPVIRISTVHGGLTPVMRGGGQQSLSLRLQDREGKEWVLRSVNKNPEKVLPEVFRQTFAKDVFVDAMSAQHPYSALVVPVIAAAVGVPHANPVIGLVAPDTALGMYEKEFANTICLLEEREAIGKSDNSEKMFRETTADHAVGFDSVLFLKARLLDVFLGDWDRHEDQWRWALDRSGKNKRYIAVPRDRDQVFHVMQGLFPNVAASPFGIPYLHDFDGQIRQINAFFTESNVFNKRFLNGFNEETWMKIVGEFTAVLTDPVLEAALQCLPAEMYYLRHDELLRKWKQRRANLPQAMHTYYRFLNRIVDIETSDKNEIVSFTDAPAHGLQVTIHKKTKSGKRDELLYERIFYPGVTKEIRLFLYDGNDSVMVNTRSSIRLRMVGAEGEKLYEFQRTGRKINLYGMKNNVKTSGDIAGVKQRLRDDSLNTRHVTTNPYNKVLPLLIGGINPDQGLLLGFSIRFTNQGFRKEPYGSSQQVSFQHSFATNAFSSSFHGEWIGEPGRPDLVADVKALAPDNTQNFFGLGNNSAFHKTGDYIHYYRTTFQLYEINPSLRWRSGDAAFSAGPSLQFYRYDADDNNANLIQNPALVGSYDSSTIAADKSFAGVRIDYTIDTRDNKTLTSNGLLFHLGLWGAKGLNSYSSSFVQFTPEFVFYKSLGHRAAVVVANRTGAGITFGKTAFYQSLFLGGHDNLYGFRQFRFAGQQLVYDNFETRIRLAQVGSYILPGQLGAVAFYDAGKVWSPQRNSATIHQGVGAGLYFAPAQLAVIQLVAGYSEEGWYPYLRFGFRF